MRTKKDITILTENKKFIVVCRTEYLKQKKVYVVIYLKKYNYFYESLNIQSNNIEDEIKKLKKYIDTLAKLKIKVIDKTSKGFYCVQCEKFSKNPLMVTNNKPELIKTKKENVFNLVKLHYDGCRGWN